MSIVFPINPGQLTGCVGLDEIPAEIFIKFFLKQGESEIFKCRLVSRKWNDLATYVLRKIHKDLKFMSDERLSEFNKIIPTNGSHHLVPFSKFEFDLKKLRVKSVQEFAKGFGGNAEAYTFQSLFGLKRVSRWDSPRDVEVTPGGLEERGLILLQLLIHSPQLKSLRFNMEFPFLLPLDSTRCLKVFPHLKFIEFKFRCDPYKYNEASLLEKLVQLSPGLKALYLSSESFRRYNYDHPASWALVKKLPKFLQRIPSRIKLGIAFEWDEDDEDIVQELIKLGRTIIYTKTSLSPGGQMNSLVWSWVTSQANSLVRLELWGFSKVENPVVSCPVFPKCVELEIDIVHWRPKIGVYLKFPNVRKLTLHSVSYHTLSHFVSKFPLLEELRIGGRVATDGWGMLVTGETTVFPKEEEMKQLATELWDRPGTQGICKANPLQKIPKLKVLRVLTWSPGFCWGLIYHSLRNEMSPLNLLELAIDGGQYVRYAKLPTNEDMMKHKEMLATANHKIIRFSKSEDIYGC